MSIDDCIEAFDRAITGTGVEYSSPDLNARLAEGTKYLVLMRVMQAAGTSPTITVKIERSNDNLSWGDKQVLFSGVTLANGISYAQDVGAVPGGCFARLSVQLGGTSPSAQVTLTVTARSVPAFSPTDLANLVLWLRADLGITLNSGNVSAWADQAGADTAHDLSQGTAGNQPPWVASESAANNRPSVDPDGSSDRLQAASATPWRHLHDGTGGTLIAVLKATGAGDDQYAISSWGPTVNDPGASIIYYGTTTDYWRLLVRNGSGGTVINVNTGNNTAVDGSVHIVAFRYQEGRSPNEYDLRLDGVEKAAGNSSAAPSSGDGAALMIGARPLSTPDAFSSCPVLELLTFQRVLTDAELTQLESYLRTIYGTP